MITFHDYRIVALCQHRSIPNCFHNSPLCSSKDSTHVAGLAISCEIRLDLYLPLLRAALSSSWLPRNETKSCVAWSWNMNRSEILARHSNRFLLNFRMPRPLCECGRPKPSIRSHNASRHSAFSAFGRSRNRFRTPGSIESDLANHLPQFFRGNGDELLRAFEGTITPTSNRFQRLDLFWSCAVFAPRKVGRLHFDSAQRDNVGSANNTDIFTSGSRQPTAC